MIAASLGTAHNNGITYFFSPQWEKYKFISHGFSSRSGGVSEGPFASLNLGYREGDVPGAVTENRRKFLEIFGQKPGSLVCGEQVHGINVHLVEKSVFYDYNDQGRVIPAADALVTTEPGEVLGALSADCLISFFLDPITPAIGLAHAGWRGTCSGILAGVVDSMCRFLGSKAEQLEVFMAPCIGETCYEVGGEVLDFCAGSLWKEDIVFLPGITPGRPFLDLQKTNFNILQKMGVQPGKIFGNKCCTCCNQHLFYSHRGVKGRPTGRQMGIIFLR
ncbi:MAG: peptidoglycan editing factor PgeF [Dethiobacteria bacterium]|jgi:YfiH family protein